MLRYANHVVLPKILRVKIFRGFFSGFGSSQPSLKILLCKFLRKSHGTSKLLILKIFRVYGTG